ncbi:hypothetical protein JB92DRAFT_1728434 [Gautieria morchelliformis]|nr:hypothetical protein JB92DRAFT_1728434 [Gautieria morchelliformis]
MSAALEFAESVVSVLQLTATTISTCYNYRSRNKSASGDKKRIIDQLLGLQEVLDEVRQLVEHEETRASSRVSALIEFLNTPDGLPRCRAELDSLKAMLENIDKTERPDPTTVPSLVDFGLKRGSDAKALPEPSTVAKQSNKQTKLQKDRLIIDKWLSPPDHLSKHLNACKERHETTGSWFLQGEHFKGWKGLRSSFLWLHGISGAGKTILCSTIIEEISLHCKSDPSLAVAFFYFDFDDKQIRSGDVLRSLIQQLFSQCPSIPNALAKIYDYDADEDGSLMSALKSLIGSFQDVYIVLDALDECPERARFLGLLKEIHGWRLGALHLLATSQKVIDIEETLSGLVSHQVPMDESLVNGDIGFYLRKTLEDDIKLSMCSAEEKEMIKTKLVEGAHGM